MPPCSPHCAGSFILLMSFTPGEPIEAQACAPAASATTGALLTRAPDRSAPTQQRSLGSDLLRSDALLGPSGLDAMAESSYQEYSTLNSRATSRCLHNQMQPKLNICTPWVGAPRRRASMPLGQQRCQPTSCPRPGQPPEPAPGSPP